MEEDNEWWNPPHPDYEEERALELRALILDELAKIEANPDKSEIGYQYADGVTLKIFWGDYEDEHGRDVAYALEGDGFNVEYRICAGSSPETIDDFLWLDYVEGDDKAKAWLKNTPARSKLAAKDYSQRYS